MHADAYASQQYPRSFTKVPSPIITAYYRSAASARSDYPAMVGGVEERRIVVINRFLSHNSSVDSDVSKIACTSFTQALPSNAWS